jgi:hypothetical protein
MAPRLPELLSLACIDYGPSHMDILEASFFNQLRGLTFRLAGDAGDTLFVKDLHGRFPVMMSSDGEAFLVGFVAEGHGLCVIAYNPRTRRGSFCKLNKLRIDQFVGRSKLPFN